jgi:hypothetical protein
MKLLLAEPITLQADRAQSLDQLWHEAATLGGVRVWQYEVGSTIEVTITFTRRSGTKVEAKGKNTNIAFAIASAINEAREMGAGRTE